MIKTALFIIFIGGFSFNGTDRFTCEKQDTNQSLLQMNNCVPATTDTIYRSGGNFIWTPKVYRSEVLFVSSREELIRMIKANKDSALLVWDIKKDKMLKFEIIPVTKKWKEEIQKEEIIDYKIEEGQ